MDEIASELKALWIEDPVRVASVVVVPAVLWTFTLLLWVVTP